MTIHDGVFAVAPPIAVAVFLIAYFNWRKRFMNWVLGGDERGHGLSTST